MNIWTPPILVAPNTPKRSPDKKLCAIIDSMKLLLHTCCAPCSVYCIKSLRAENIEPTLYWFNPNIHPYAEYKARRDCLREYVKLINAKLVEDDAYGLDEFVCNVSDKLDRRCEAYCYPLRLRQAFKFAKEHGYDAISTTLLYSIYQKHDFIAKLMQALSSEFGVEFLYRDFREGWREGQDEARRIGLYMQKYCGCVFSEEESGFGREFGRKMNKLDVSPTNANVRKLIDESKSPDGLIRPAEVVAALANKTTATRTK